MKKYFFILTALLLTASTVWAEEADLQGHVIRIDYPQNRVLLRNEVKNKIGLRDYRVAIKQGMINDYKKNDQLKIWLMEDGKQAAMIEKIR